MVIENTSLAFNMPSILKSLSGPIFIELSDKEHEKGTYGYCNNHLTEHLLDVLLFRDKGGL